MGRGAPRGAQGDGRRSMLRRLPRGGFAVAGLRGGQGTDQGGRPVRVPVPPEVRQDRTEERARSVADVQSRPLRVAPQSLRLERIVHRRIPVRIRVRRVARRRPLGFVLHRRRERTARLLPPRRPRARARRPRRSLAAGIRALRRHRRRRVTPRDGRRGKRVLDAGVVLRGRGAVGVHRRSPGLPRRVRDARQGGRGGDARAGRVASQSRGASQPPLRRLAHQVRRLRAPGRVRAAFAGRHRARRERRAAPGGARLSQGTRRPNINSRRRVRRGASGRR